MITDFHFLRPWWLLAVVAAALLVWLLDRRGDVRRRWQNLIAPNLLDHLLVDNGHVRGLRPVHLMAGLLALSAVAVAGPTWEKERPPFTEDLAPLAIAIDLGSTMDATDVSPTRIERAKLKVQDIMQRRKGARTALFAYAGSAHMVLPLTDDMSLVTTYISALSTALMPIKGKDTAKALEVVETALAGESVPGTILFMTDGVERASFGAFTGYKGRNDLMVLGIGTAEGGAVMLARGQYLTDVNGARVQARLDVDALKELQHNSSVQIATITLDDTDIDWIIHRVQSAFTQKTDEGLERWRDFGWYLTIPVALIAMLTFRRGSRVHWLGAVMPLLLISLAAAPPTKAADFADIWLTPDQQGQRAFDIGDYSGAAAHFENPAWRGAALYRTGRYQDAIDAFARSTDSESYYNAGNALMHLDKADEAAAAYRQALKQRPNWQQAAANLELAERRKKEKEDQEKERQQEQAGLDPDQIQFDDKAGKGKEGQVNVAVQTAEVWMRNIQVSPAQLLARKFALESARDKPQ